MSDDYRTYNDNTVHNMWVDYTSAQYEGSPKTGYGYFGNTGSSVPLSRDEIQQRIAQPATSVGQSAYRAKCIREQIRRSEQSLRSLTRRLEKITSPGKLEHYRHRISETHARIHSLEMQLKEEEQNGRNLKARNTKLYTILIAALCIGIVIWAAL